MQEKKVSIPGISCPHCVMAIKRELAELEGIDTADIDPVAKTALIRWRSPLTWERIRETLEEAGYPPAE